jgi:hypothetical protein
MAANGEAESDSALHSSAEEGWRGAILMVKVAQAARCAPAEFRRRTWQQQQQTAARGAPVMVGAESLEEDKVKVWGAMRNRRALKRGSGSWAENGQARTASLRGPPRGAGIHAPQKVATREATGIRCGALIARGSRRI